VVRSLGIQKLILETNAEREEFLSKQMSRLPEWLKSALNEDGSEEGRQDEASGRNVALETPEAITKFFVSQILNNPSVISAYLGNEGMDVDSLEDLVTETISQILPSFLMDNPWLLEVTLDELYEYEQNSSAEASSTASNDELT
jgi:hypothetical protein